MCEPGVQLKSSMCNRKLIGARYFNKNVLAQDSNISFVYNSPRDETGHGTHTTSIATGNCVRGVSYFEYVKGTARGVVPCVRLAVYKVTWSRGGSLTSDVIVGIDQALADGVDIISMLISFRGALPYKDPISITSFAAMEIGVLVYSSAENRGTLTLDNGKTIIGWSLFPGRALLKTSLMYNETLTGCNLPVLLLESANNAIVVCFEGPRINNQISTVIEFAVTGAVFISIDEREEYHFPGVTIKPMDAPTVINYAKSTIDPKATIKFRQTFVGRGAKRAP
ncbi:hypothetical protein GIB67_036566 [Kingdonia uniflora]|uniref:Peptidase S8/S53 domain-containing protein n=1 Tax=Kingdonia uniflora TaxID=39325 RepID=A0A7J7NC16_9MAGN|nr:hypothetical protein GIB67_036566 [Kingdonia uniflora]